MTDETDAYGVKINGVYFVSMDAAKAIVDEARLDGWNLALEEAADAVGEVGDHAAAGAYIDAIRALKEDKNV